FDCRTFQSALLPMRALMKSMRMPRRRLTFRRPLAAVDCAIIERMQISPPCVVSLTWKLQDTLGNLIDELKDPVEFFFGGDDLLAKVEEALVDQEPGFTAQLHLEPEHAFGEYDSKLVFFEQRSIFQG